MENFIVGEYLIIPAKNQVMRESEIQNLTPKMMAVLCVLAANSKQTVSKEAIYSEVWKTVEVSDLVLTRAIADLRKVFNESAKNAIYILTVSKKGYCLNQDVKAEAILNNHSLPNFPNESQNYFQTPKSKLVLITILCSLTLALILTLFNIVYYEQEPSVGFLPGKPEHLSTGPEITRHPRFTPDGDKVFYLTSNSDGLNQITSYSLSSNSSKNVYRSASAIRYPTISSDGKRLAFFQQRAGHCKIKILELNNLTPDEEIECPVALSRSLDWAPNSEALLTNRYDAEKEITGLAIYDLSQNSYVKEFYPKESQTGYLFPRFSPDGKRIATFYVIPSANLSTVRILNIKDGTFTDFATENSYINQIVWGGNTTIYYAVASGDREGVWSLDLKTGYKEFIFSENIIDMDYSIKSNAFVMNKEQRELDVWSFTPSQKQSAHTQETFSSRIDRDPVPSPDNARLAFVSDRDNANNVWVKNRKNNDKQKLTSFKNGTISDLYWASDDSIYFSRSIAQESIAYKLKPGMELERIFNASNNFRFKYLSADGQRLYFTSDRDGNWKTFLLDLSSNQQEELLSFPVDKIRESNGVIYYQSYADTALYQIQLESAKGETSPFFQQSLAMASWEISGNQLYFVAPGKHKNSLLYRVNLDDKKLAQIGEFPVSYAKPNYGLSIAQESGEIFYTRLNDFDRDILLLKGR